MSAGAADFDPWVISQDNLYSVWESSCVGTQRWASAPALPEDHLHKQSFLLVNKRGKVDAVLSLRGIDSLVCFSIIFINWKKSLLVKEASYRVELRPYSKFNKTQKGLGWFISKLGSAWKNSASCSFIHVHMAYGSRTQRAVPVFQNSSVVLLFQPLSVSANGFFCHSVNQRNRKGSDVGPASPFSVQIEQVGRVVCRP